MFAEHSPPRICPDNGPECDEDSAHSYVQQYEKHGDNLKGATRMWNWDSGGLTDQLAVRKREGKASSPNSTERA